MTKKESKKNKSTESLTPQMREVWGLIFIFLAGFIAISIQYPNSTGFLGYWTVEYFIKNVVGEGVFYLPFFLAGGGISFFVSYKERFQPVLYGLLGAFLAFVIFLEFKINGPAQIVSFPISNSGGGLIGVVGAYIFYKTLGTYGSLLTLAVITLVSCILVFNFSIRGMIVLMGRVIKVIGALSASAHQEKKDAWLRGLVLLLFYRRKQETYSNQSLHSLRDITTIPTTSDPKPTPKKHLPIVNEPELPQLEPEIFPKKVPIVKTVTNTGDGEYALPPLSLLEKQKSQRQSASAKMNESKEKAAALEVALDSFNVDAKVVNITPGPTVTRYELKPGVGVKISKITNLSQDIALKLAAPAVRIEAPIPGTSLIGIEVPNLSVDVVRARSIIEQVSFMDADKQLLCAMGMTITGEPVTMQLEKMPHVLIAGATGSGKSVCVNSIIMSILLRSDPDTVKFLMIDPKKVELSLYSDIPHLLAPVVTNPHYAAATLKQWALVEMERRYESFSKVGTKDISGFNRYLQELEEKRRKAPVIEDENGASPEEEEPLTPYDNLKKLPYIVVVIDELADLMMVASQDVENTICRLAQMARATGIHLVIATQRPSVNVVTGLIKANVPSRIAFYVQSQIDSRTILDTGGAEKLIGKGDMLYQPAGALHPKRVQGIFISEDEVKRVVEFVKKQGKPLYSADVMDVKLEEKSDENEEIDSEDDMFEQAKEVIKSTKYASTSYLQRKLRIGYNRAARLMDELEEKGVVSPYDEESKKRTVLI